MERVKGKQGGMRAWLTAALALACAAGCAIAAGAQRQRAEAEDAAQQSAAPAAAQAQTPNQPAGPSGKVPPGVRLEAQMPAPGAPRPFRFPRAASRVLPNGLEVYVESLDRQPEVSITLLIPSAGSFYDPAGKAGLAALTAGVLPEGTTRRTAQEIAEAIDFVGGTLNTAAESDTASVTITVTKKDFPLAMDLISDLVMHPAFEPREIERKRQQTLSNLEVESADGSYLAQAVAARSLFGLHPYGLPEEGTPESVRAIGREDLTEFQKTRYVPRGSFLSIAGEVTAEEAMGAAQKFFGEWEGIAPQFTAPAIPEPAGGENFVLVDKPEAVQTQIRVIWPAIARNSPDYLPLYVANRVFGGGESSRLNAQMRQQRGLTYGAYAVLGARARAGAFSAGLSTRTETTVEALELMLGLVQKMGTGNVTAEELRFAKDYLIGAFPMQAETPEQIAGRILSLPLFGLPRDYYEHYRENLEGISLAQVNAMAAKYYGATNRTVVLVGNVAAFHDALKRAYPEARLTEVRAAELDLLAADLRHKPTGDSPDAGVAAATAESLAQGKELLAAAEKSAGGEALAGIRTLDVDAQGKLYQQAGNPDVKLHLQVSYPDHMRLEMKLPVASVTQGFDGATGWLQYPGGVSEVSADAVREYQRSILLTGGIGILTEGASGTVEVQYVGEEEVQGKKAIAALWRGPSGAVRLLVDAETHLLVAARFLSAGQQGVADTLQVWDDYRLVDGVQFPFHSVTFQEGVRRSEIFVQQVKFNQPMDTALFVKPSP
ncbi:MAG TPA: pitrilysin family protein [Candidatus Acidoferrales bacterium]|nr:pitrilysin family protein [Candidatus Acidoferrales bacterium]